MNADVVLRRASVQDLAAILAVERSGFTGEAFSRRQLRYLVTRSKGAVFVTVCAGRVTGYISLLTSARHGQGRVYSIAVKPEYRGQGIAERLMDAGLDFAREQGLNAVFLEVETGNRAARALYLKKGFVERCTKPGYYHNGADALSMVRHA